MKAGLFLLTALVGICGMHIGQKLKLPAGRLVGAMLAVMLLGICTGRAFFPADARKVVQIFSGALIGSKISRRDIAGFKRIWKPFLLMLAGILTINVAIGIVIFRFSPLDFFTAMLSAAPGGLSDMAIMSEDFGANPEYVAVLQLVRLLAIYIIIVPIFRRQNANFHGSELPGCQPQTDTTSSGLIESTGRKVKIVQLLLTVLFASGTGVLLWWLDVSAGAMIGGMLGAMAFNLCAQKAYFPQSIRGYIQALAGAYIGSQITMNTLRTIGDITLPVFCIVVGTVVYTFSVSYFMRKFSTLDYQTCLLSSAPGGLQEMGLMAMDLGADAPKVVLLQTLRLFFAVSAFPLISQIVARFFG